MIGGNLNSCIDLRVYIMLAILAFITVITQPYCLICSAQYQITDYQTKLTDSKRGDLLSSWPIEINKRYEFNHDSDLQTTYQQQTTGNKFEPCLEQTETCTVLNRLRRLVASCSRLRSTKTPNRLVCVPFTRRRTTTTIQSPDINSNLWNLVRGTQAADQVALAGPYNPEETGDKTVNRFAITRNLDGFDRLGRRKAFVDHIDWLTPLDGDQTELMAARSFSSTPSRLNNRWQESARSFRDQTNHVFQNDTLGPCMIELSGRMSWERLNNCLIYAMHNYASPQADSHIDSDRRAGRLNPFESFLFAGTAGESPKRSTEESPLNWTLAKAIRKELHELDGSSENAFRLFGSGEPASQQIDQSQADQLPPLKHAGETGVTTTTTTSTSTTTAIATTTETVAPVSITENSNIVNNVPLVMPVAEEEALECRMRNYTFRAINRDNKGNQCSGFVKASICYGGCDTGEIADWLFPHKKSIHKVCQHGLRVRRKVILPECNSLVADRELSVYHYVDARTCKCEICNKTNTTCMGSLTAPNL